MSTLLGFSCGRVCGVVDVVLNLFPSCAMQTVEEIQRIVREAQTPPAGPAGWDNDEYIDDAMDQEQYESSFDEWGMGTSI